MEHNHINTAQKVGLMSRDVPGIHRTLFDTVPGAKTLLHNPGDSNSLKLPDRQIIIKNITRFQLQIPTGHGM